MSIGDKLRNLLIKDYTEKIRVFLNTDSADLNNLPLVLYSVNQPTSSRLIKIITLLVCAGGAVWFGVGFFNEYREVRRFKEADKLLAKQEYAKAIEAYDRLLTANVDRNHLIWINRGYAFLGLDQYQQMLHSCSTATLIDPDAALAWNCQGEALYYLNQNQNSLKAFEAAISKNSTDATFWLNKVRVLSKLKAYDKAIAASEQAIQLIKQSPLEDKQKSATSLAIAFNQKGQNLLKIKQYTQSLAAFEQSLHISPNYLSALQGKGIALYELKKYEQAIAIFNQILQRQHLTNEHHASILLYKGVSLCQIQKNLEGEQAFQDFLVLNSNIQGMEIAQKGCGIQ